MQFTFTPDQIALRDGMSSFFMAEVPPEKLRHLIEKNEGRSAGLRGKIAEQGLFGLSVPEAQGGLGLGDGDWALMTQELGYFALPDFVAETAYASTGLLAALADNAHVAQVLEQMAAGSATVAIAHPINPLVGDADLADYTLMPGANGALDEVHLVPKAQLRFSARHESIDASRHLVQASFSPSAATQIAAGAQAQALWAQALNRAAVGCAGQMIGLAQRMLNMSVDYVAQRKQFGKPLGSFQAVKHQLADVVVKIEFAKPVLYKAAWALANQAAHADIAVSHAKLVCGDAAWFAARKGIQVHGAMGYTWEVDLQMFMKRAWALNSVWGDNAFHKARMADALLAQDAPLGPGTAF